MAKKRKKRQGTKVAKDQNDPLKKTSEIISEEKQEVMDFVSPSLKLPDIEKINSDLEKIDLSNFENMKVPVFDLKKIESDLNKMELPDFDLEKIQKDLEKSLEGFSMGNQEDDKKEK